MSDQKPNHPGTGRYRNDAKQQWECWAVNQRTGEEVLLGYWAYSQGEQACAEWESRVWRALLDIEREERMSEQERDDAPWEPWRPRIGQKVRIRLSGECPLPLKPASAGRYVEHYPSQDGLEGSVIALVDWRTHAPGHDYLVGLPEVRHANGICCMAGTFAATELEPLEE